MGGWRDIQGGVKCVTNKLTTHQLLNIQQKHEITQSSHLATMKKFELCEAVAWLMGINHVHGWGREWPGVQQNMAWLLCLKQEPPILPRYQFDVSAGALKPSHLLVYGVQCAHTNCASGVGLLPSFTGKINHF